jgi:hypothetical protein
VATLARVHTLPYFDECIHKRLLVSQRDYRYPTMNGNIFQHFSCHSVVETANLLKFLLSCMVISCVRRVANDSIVCSESLRRVTNDSIVSHRFV